MTDKDRFDACMRFAEFGASKFDRRRQYEWKITIAFWTLLVLSIWHLRCNQTTTDKWIIFIEFLAAVAFILVWIRGTWVANANDKAISDYFMRSADELLRGTSTIQPSTFPNRIKPKSLKWCIGFLRDWSGLFQSITTLALAALLLVIGIWGSPKP